MPYDAEIAELRKLLSSGQITSRDLEHVRDRLLAFRGNVANEPDNRMLLFWLDWSIQKAEELISQAETTNIVR